MRKSTLTVRGIAVGLAGLVIITTSSMYVALKMGALPWPTVFVTVLSVALLGKAKGSTLSEINCTHTMMSAGAMVSGGLAFTLPGLWLLGSEMSFLSIIVVAVCGALMGTVCTILNHKKFIKEQSLPYPIGTASYDTLMAAKNGKEAPYLFSSMGISAIFTFFRDFLKMVPSVIGSGTLSFYVSPMALGIGALIGPSLAFMWILGMVIGYFVLVPAGLHFGIFSNADFANTFRSELGIGIMIGTGVGVVLKAIISYFKNNKTKTERSDKSWFMFITVSVICVVILSIFTEISLLRSLLLIPGIYIATYLSGMLTGQTGINPMEVFAILTVLLMNLVSKGSLSSSFAICGIVAVSCGLGGDVMNDLKSGSLVGTDYHDQLWAETIGGVIGAVVAAVVFCVMDCGINYPAPQAKAVASMVGGLNIPLAFYIGLVIGVVMFVLGLPSATFGLGFYLGTYITTAITAGALLTYISKKVFKKDKSGIIASGLLGGEGITGVIISFL